MEADIINQFGFTFRNNISKWGENYVQDHLNYTFEKLEQTFCKRFRIVKNNEEVSMQLRNIQQQTTKCVEV
jgi:predicted chitinase